MSSPVAFVIPAPAPWWKPLARSDRRALAWFVFIPLVLFVVPALFGHPAIDADNLIQNFPLRVLAGQQIASGHLPLLDPLTNAGTPLLGGMNAGALYPLTVIFAFIPAIVAWIFNMIVVYVTSAVGVFVLLRWHGIRTVPAFAAGLSYTYTGAMIGQMVHLGVVQGFSFIPWAVVLMLALSRRLRYVSPRDLVALTGAPGTAVDLRSGAVMGADLLNGRAARHRDHGTPHPRRRAVRAAPSFVVLALDVATTRGLPGDAGRGLRLGRRHRADPTASRLVLHQLL